MDIQQLITGLPIRVIRGDLPVAVTDIADDSRRVTPGALFIARAGTRSDGVRYIPQAVAAGAAAVLTDRPDRIDPETDVVCLSCENATALVPDLAARFFGDPTDDLTVIGITGTNGKTTVAWLLRQLFAHLARPFGLIGTIETDLGDDRPTPAALTTPGIIDLRRALARMVENGLSGCIMETSSHALDQGRTAGLEFDCAVFTNLSGDHLDYHGTMEAYAHAKAKLFAQLAPDVGLACLNIDDPWSQKMHDAAAGTVIRCSMTDAAADYFAEVLAEQPTGARIRITRPTGDAVTATSPLVGRHNVMNLLQAVAVIDSVGEQVNVGALTEMIESLHAAPGRLERVRLVDGGDPPFGVIVDYAHTDDALKNVLLALRPVTDGRLRVLFGCGGDRDRTKRPRMAAVAAELADDIFITSDNPRTEDPAAIIDEIITGIPADARDQTQVEVDRAAAIGKIIKQAEPGDVVLIAGKGHEDYQIIGDQRRPFDDRRAAAAALTERFSTTPTRHTE